MIYTRQYINWSIYRCIPFDLSFLTEIATAWMPQIIETLCLYRYTTWKYFENRLVVHGSFTWTIGASVVAGNGFFKFSNIICFQFLSRKQNYQKLILKIYQRNLVLYKNYRYTKYNTNKNRINLKKKRISN